MLKLQEFVHFEGLQSVPHHQIDTFITRERGMYGAQCQSLLSRLTSKFTKEFKFSRVQDPDEIMDLVIDLRTLGKTDIKLPASLYTFLFYTSGSDADLECEFGIFTVGANVTGGYLELELDFDDDMIKGCGKIFICVDLKMKQFGRLYLQHEGVFRSFHEEFLSFFEAFVQMIEQFEIGDSVLNRELIQEFMV